MCICSYQILKIIIFNENINSFNPSCMWYFLESYECINVFLVQIEFIRISLLSKFYLLHSESLGLFHFPRFIISDHFTLNRVRNVKFATYLKFATCENTNKINELW